MTRVALLFGWLLIALAGCGKVPSPEFRANQVEWVKQERLNLEQGEHFRPEYKQEVATLLTVKRTR
jgi:hypothetical protein